MGRHHVAVRGDGLQERRLDANIMKNSCGVSSRLGDVELPCKKEAEN